MRESSWLLGKGVSLRARNTPDPTAAALRRRVDQAHASSRRRLSDRIEALVEEACLSGDLDTATALLTAFETALKPREGGNRRSSETSGVTIERLHGMIERQRRNLQR